MRKSKNVLRPMSFTLNEYWVESRFTKWKSQASIQNYKTEYFKLLHFRICAQFGGLRRDSRYTRHQKRRLVKGTKSQHMITKWNFYRKYQFYWKALGSDAWQYENNFWYVMLCIASWTRHRKDAWPEWARLHKTCLSMLKDIIYRYYYQMCNFDL